jgi:hypothetical protein
MSVEEPASNPDFRKKFAKPEKKRILVIKKKCREVLDEK